MDYTLEDTIFSTFTTRDIHGRPTSLVSPIMAVYMDDVLPPLVSGVLVTPDYDGKIGLNMLQINATAVNGFLDKKQYSCVLESGTVDAIDVTGETIEKFSIGMRTNMVITFSS